MAEQPTGTVTLLFTDIEGSTRLLDRLGTARYAQSLELHRRLIREALERNSGYEVDCEGDAFFVAFGRATDAVAAAAEAQRALADAEWPEEQPIRVRIGIHTGEPLVAPPRYVGLDVHKAARIMAAGHGGQVLLSAATQRLVDPATPVVSLGEHRLKDLSQPEPLYQLRVEGQPDEFPALKTLGNRPTNLPVVATPFVGRAAELLELGELLLRPDVRLLTVTGPGGIGKTRLALQAAADAVEGFSDGVYWVSLAAIRDPALVVPTVAQTLGVREEPNESVSVTLGRHLREKRLLLVLDNLEHVIEVAPAFAELLAAAPRLTVLSTSREALRLRGEHLFDVPILTLPTGDETAVEAGDAVQLFLARARAADQQFKATGESVRVIAQIVCQLEGLPLAIELAAARVRALPLQALLQRLDSRLHLLTSGSRDADERQRTLRATIQWSYDLLPRPEQVLLERLSIFVGGCRLDAAEAVCDLDSSLGIGSFEGIASLIDKSLLRRRSDPDGEPRYWMLETIREYAAERLAERGPETVTTFRGRHTAWYLAVAETAASASLSAAEGDAHRLLDADQQNLRAALGSLHEARDALRLAHLGCALGEFWAISGRYSEGLAWLRRVLGRLESERTSERLETLMWATWLASELGEIEEAAQYADERIALARQSGDPKRLGSALNSSALVASRAGDSRSALACQIEAVAMARELDEPNSLRVWVGNLGFIALAAGEHQLAEQAADEFWSLCKTEHGTTGYSSALWLRGLIALRRGSNHEAVRYLRESVSGFQQLGARLWTIQTILVIAYALANDHPRLAVRLIAAATGELETLHATLSGWEEHDRDSYLGRLQAQLSRDTFAEEWNRGTALTLDQAVQAASAAAAPTSTG